MKIQTIARHQKASACLPNILTSFFRYNIGPPWFQIILFKINIATSYAMFWFVNAVTLIRFVQAVIWRRVMEINEELASTMVNRAVFVACATLGIFCHPEFKLHGTISIMQGKRVELPLAACIDGIDPLHQK